MPRRNPRRKAQLLAQPESTTSYRTAAMSDRDDEPSLSLDADLADPYPHPGEEAIDNDHDAEDDEAAQPDPVGPSAGPATVARRGNKRKKPMSKRQREAVEKKLRSLKTGLRPVPFFPAKRLDFSKNESLFRRLGLWEFAHLELDGEIRSDLLALLVANYSPTSRSSVVNDLRIKISRADLARALKLPVKKDKAVMSEEVEAGDDRAALAAVEEFVSYYVLLHEEATWMMPDEVSNWVKVIKDGQPQKLDVAGLIWFMVERELSQGHQLEYCYYAWHLQYLMKCQRPELFKAVEEVAAAEVEVEEVNVGVESRSFEDLDLPDAPDAAGENRDTELSLGYEKADQEQQFVSRDDGMDVEECQEEEEEGYQPWVLQGKMNSNMQHHLLRCDSINTKEIEVEEEEERFDPHGKFSRLGSLRSADLIQEMGPNDGPFSLPMELLDPHSGDLMGSKLDIHKSMSVKQLNHASPSVFVDAHRRNVHDEDKVPQFLHGDQLGKIGGDVPWDSRFSSFDLCMNGVQVCHSRAKMMYEEKDHECARAHIQIQALTQALHDQDEYILSLESMKIEEQSKRELAMFRFQREFGVMTELLNGYRRAMQVTQKAFAEYREKHKKDEESIYKDVDGSGGLVLSIPELEKLRLEEEEEEKAKCSLAEEIIRKFELKWVQIFDEHRYQFDLLAQRLKEVEENIKTLRGIGKCKDPES